METAAIKASGSNKYTPFTRKLTAVYTRATLEVSKYTKFFLRHLVVCTSRFQAGLRSDAPGEDDHPCPTQMPNGISLPHAFDSCKGNLHACSPCMMLPILQAFSVLYKDPLKGPLIQRCH